MKVLLTSNASHVPPRGGSTRSNLVWLRHLAANGHECRVVCAAAERRTFEERERLESEILQQEGDIEFLSVDEPSRRPIALREQIVDWRPDWVLVSSEDLSHGLLREAFRSAPGRVVYLAHTPQFFPFGGESWNRDAEATELLKNAAGIVTISHSVAKYVEQNLGVGQSAKGSRVIQPPSVIHPPIYGTPPWPAYRNWRKGCVTMINPCAVKGISIFIELAKAFPGVAFETLRGWGTTTENEATLHALPNVSLRNAVRDIDEILRETQILLMPSLWYEGFGLIVMEAMLRGIPVISSDYGGLTESTLGVSYLAPVQPIVRYEERFDGRNMPVPIIRAQNLEVWSLWLARLLDEQDTYEEVSEASRKASAQFVNSLDAGEFQRFLERLEPSGTAVSGANSLHALSSGKRALLLQQLKLRQRKQEA